jgi:hypothetical protein
MVEQPKKNLDQVRDVLCLQHYSCRLSSLIWIRFIVVHNKRHPKEIGASEIEAFLTFMAV